MVDNNNTQDQQNQSPDTPKRKFKWIGVILASIITLILLIVFLIPTVLSTSAGTSFALNIANGQIPGSIKIQNLSLGWFTGQRVTGIQLFDPEGSEVLSLEEIDIPDATLGSLLTGSKKLGKISITNVSGKIVQSEDGSLNLLNAVTKPTSSDVTDKTPDKHEASSTNVGNTPSLAVLEGLSFNLNAKQINVDYVAPNVSPAKLNIPSIEIDFKKPSDIAIALNATVSQENSAGNADVKLTAQDLISDEGRIQLSKGHVDANISIVDLPLTR